ncbi:hypothetical protein OROHE_015547 [Orobanche hederae]
MPQPHLLTHRLAVTLSCSTAPSEQLFCPIASVGLRLPFPHRVITTNSRGGNVNGKNVTTICMANPRRVNMVAKQIRRELSNMLLTDKVLQYAVLPEAALGADLYLSSLTTISDVEVSADLQVVKVYVSVFGDERGKEVALAGLISKAKYVRSQLGKRMKLRRTPEVSFLEDESLERGTRVIAILDKIKEENEKKAAKDGDPESGESDDGSDDDVDDADIIYV